METNELALYSSDFSGRNGNSNNDKKTFTEKVAMLFGIDTETLTNGIITFSMILFVLLFVGFIAVECALYEQEVVKDSVVEFGHKGHEYIQFNVDGTTTVLHSPDCPCNCVGK